MADVKENQEDLNMARHLGSGRAKGFIPSEESRQKARDSNQNKQGCICPLGSFENISDVAALVGLTGAAIRYRCNQGAKQRENGYPLSDPASTGRRDIDHREWYFTREKVDLKLGKKVRTPIGDFNSLTEAATAEKVTPAAIRHKLKSERPGYFYLDENGDCI